MKKRALLGILSLFILCFWIQAQPDYNEVIRMGNQAYNEGLYQKAISLYDSVLSDGIVSKDLFYNMGNAYFKINDLPNAILYYEKALKFDPTDEDILFNLKIANSMKVDKIESVPKLFYVQWWETLRNIFPANTWAWISVVVFTGVFLMAIIFMMSRSLPLRRTTFWLGMVFAFLFMISLIMSYQKYKEAQSNDYGIVFTPTITVKSSPSKNSVDLFVIHEGSKVKVIDEVEGWYEIRIANGSEGWLPSNAIKII